MTHVQPREIILFGPRRERKGSRSPNHFEGRCEAAKHPERGSRRISDHFFPTIAALQQPRSVSVSSWAVTVVPTRRPVPWGPGTRFCRASIVQAFTLTRKQLSSNRPGLDGLCFAPFAAPTMPLTDGHRLTVTVNESPTTACLWPRLPLHNLLGSKLDCSSAEAGIGGAI